MRCRSGHRVPELWDKFQSMTTLANRVDLNYWKLTKYASDAGTLNAT